VTSESEREQTRRVHLCSERVLACLESIGVTGLAVLAGRDPWHVMYEINLQAGRVIWRPPLTIGALQNPIDAAEREPTPPTRPAHAGG
jgi:hypothetical protein